MPGFNPESLTTLKVSNKYLYIGSLWCAIIGACLFLFLEAGWDFILVGFIIGGFLGLIVGGLYGLLKDSIKSNIDKKKSAKEWLLPFIGGLIIVYFALQSDSSGQIKNSNDHNTNFRFASPGEVWLINDDNVALSKNPEPSANKIEFLDNLVTVLTPGTSVYVLKSQGYLSPWIQVIAKKGDTPFTGWILAETIKSSHKTK